MAGPEAAHVVHIQEFHNIAELHHGDSRTDVADHRQVVRDHEVGQIALPAQVRQQIEDLGLNRHVERRGRLIQQQDFGFRCQGAGDRHALPLPTRNLVGKAEADRGAKAHVFQQPRDPRVDISEAVKHESFAEHPVDRMPGMQRGIGVAPFLLRLLQPSLNLAQHQVDHAFGLGLADVALLCDILDECGSANGVELLFVDRTETVLVRTPHIVGL